MNEDKIQKQIEEIEKEIRETPYHKGTERHIGRLKAKLANLRNQLVKKGGTGGGGGGGFAIKKQGDATVVLVGMPSVGKSTLLNKLTGAHSKVGHYPFTTLEVIPGTLLYKGANIQIFDVPGLIQGAAQGKGGGKEILSVVRIADLLLMMASVSETETMPLMKQELAKAGVRIDQDPPPIEIEKRQKGGIEVQGSPGLSLEIIRELTKEFRLMNAKMIFGKKVTQDQLIDVLAGNRVYVDSLSVFSKTDLVSKKELEKIKEKHPGAVFISPKQKSGLGELKQEIFDRLQLIRVFLKEELNGEPDSEPLILRKGETVRDAALKISGQLAQELEGARISGPSALFPNQTVGVEHKLRDGDQVYFSKQV